MTAPAKLPFYLALAGPTAAGKTAAALAIAKRHPCEIISVDSALVFKGMDIGTAKPSADELASVPHHLIDIRDPLTAYSAAEFVRDAHALIADISRRGKLPLLVGGTMLYFKALFDGLDDMPPADPLIRAELEHEAAEKSWPAMHAELQKIDPLTAQRLAPADSQRIQRALEVFRITGKPLSGFHVSKERGSSHLEKTCAFFSLEPVQRSWLHERIALRVDQMLVQGLIEEVHALRHRGDLHSDLPAIRAVGYRQVWEALDGKFPMTELRDRIIFATRQLAKRQITWLRSMPQRQIIAADEPDAVDLLLESLTQKITPLS